MEVVTQCDLCGSTDQKPFEEYERYGQRFTLVECRACGLAYLTPRPTKDEIAHYYDESYTNIHAIYSEPKLLSLILPFFRLILRFRYEGSGKSLRALAVRWLFFPWELRWKAFVRNTNIDQIEGIGRVLDVGCGRGYWLASMRRWGFDCYGCEPDRRATEHASGLGLSVTCGDLLTAKFPDNYFDIVRFNHVLEHVYEPTLVLAEARRIVRSKTGLIIVEVPNHSGVACQVFRFAEDVPRHLYSFSPDNLNRYFEKASLRVVRLETRTWHPHCVYSQYWRFISQKSNNLSAEEKRNIEKIWSFKNRKRQREYKATAAFFDSLGCGTAIIAVGKKDE
jgi:SAM-dependent methyltransferase